MVGVGPRRGRVEKLVGASGGDPVGPVTVSEWNRRSVGGGTGGWGTGGLTRRLSVGGYGNGRRVERVSRTPPLIGFLKPSLCKESLPPSLSVGGGAREDRGDGAGP